MEAEVASYTNKQRETYHFKCCRGGAEFMEGAL